ncbi:MAG: hypothetical protein PHE55_21875, partial [Methylococcaceae bacterium]|nr:hypothetical protein [Methylococcaceae bacterium]
QVLDIREMSGQPALIFGLVHGTPLLKFMYIAAAPMAILISNLAGRISRSKMVLVRDEER